MELSSFQLETIVDFHPTVAAVLNVTPNHMDRYETLMDYAAAKHNIFRNQTAGDAAILNADDEIVSSWANGLRAHVVPFSVKSELAEGLFLRGRELVSRTKDGERVLMSRDEMQLRGTHNVEERSGGDRGWPGLRSVAWSLCAKRFVAFDPWNTGWKRWPKLTACGLSTIRKPPASMPR